MITVTRKMSFDAAHRILNHESKCKYLHGHTYTAEVTITLQSERNLDELGRVVDFGEIKKRVGKWIDENWDHNIILNSKDPLWEIVLLHRKFQTPIFGGREPYIMDVNPTAENLAMELNNVCCRILPIELTVTNIRIWETPNCFADYVNEGATT